MDHQIWFETHIPEPPAKYSNNLENHNPHDGEDDNGETHISLDLQVKHANNDADEIHDGYDIKLYVYRDNQKSYGRHQIESFIRKDQTYNK